MCQNRKEMINECNMRQEEEGDQGPLAHCV